MKNTSTSSIQTTVKTPTETRSNDHQTARIKPSNNTSNNNKRK